MTSVGTTIQPIRQPESGLADFHPADGAFYIYADVSCFTDDSMDFARRLLVEAGVAVAPGIGFDPARGAGHIRLSFANTTADLIKAMDRVGSWVQ